ncbi:hypothetical protein GFV14_00746 [Candidatus Hartigia pinicola]|nr:hypothetical protein GFV14_00746 [Candidatus Hartigia pinicola]
MRLCSVKKILLIFLLSLLPFSVLTEEIGSVDTVFKIFGPNYRIIIETFNDPEIDNIICYLSRSKTGGLKSSIGVSEETSEAAISCHQTGPVKLTDRIKRAQKKPQVVFQKRTSLVFKKLQVVRFYDSKRNTLVYLTYSNKIIDGSPKNALSAVPIIRW